MRLLREILLPVNCCASPAWHLKRLYEHNGKIWQAIVVFDSGLITLSRARKELRAGVIAYLDNARKGDTITGIKIPSGNDE